VSTSPEFADALVAAPAGVALLAAVGTKEFKSVEEACEATVKTCNPTKPDAKRVKTYDKYYPAWQGLYRSLKKDFERLAN